MLEDAGGQKRTINYGGPFVVPPRGFVVLGVDTNRAVNGDGCTKWK
jgi:hypothetical protein